LGDKYIHNIQLIFQEKNVFENDITDVGGVNAKAFNLLVRLRGFNPQTLGTAKWLWLLMRLWRQTL
jgi:hypothetical protein